jgi:hypothetical protein
MKILCYNVNNNIPDTAELFMEYLKEGSIVNA